MASAKREWKEPILANPKTFYHDFHSYVAHRVNCKNLLDLIDEFKNGGLSQGRKFEILGSGGLRSVRLGNTDRMLLIVHKGYVILQNIALEHDYEDKHVYKIRYKLGSYIKDNFPDSEEELKQL
jgi:hypothetical protein